MFDTPLIEFFSRIHPLSPFAFWLPVLGLVSWWSLQQGTGAARFAGLVAIGIVAWSLAEYLLHRYVFHYIGPKPWQRRLYFVLHGVHHDFPQDIKRLVMPLGVSIPLGLGFFLLMSVFFSQSVALGLFVGFALGYLAYDGIHYFTHHRPARSKLGKYLKRYHMVHHFTGMEAKWGVSSPLWDYVFSTTDDDAPEGGAANATSG